MNTVKKLGKGCGPAFSKLDENPFRAAQPDVGTADVGKLSFKSYSAVHGVDACAAEGINLFSEKLFKTEQAGCHHRDALHQSISSYTVSGGVMSIDGFFR